MIIYFADYVLIVTSIIFLLIASFTDIKKKEVPNWISYGFLFTVLMIRFIVSSISLDFSYILDGLIGFGIFYILGEILYYSRFFARADARILRAIGAAMFGIKVTEYKIFSGIFSTLNGFIINFLLNFLIVGFFFGLFFSIGLAIKHRKKFNREFRSIDKKKLILILILSLIFLGLSILTKSFFTIFVLIFLILIFLYIFIRITDKVAMIKEILTKNLREGDLIPKDIKINNRIIKAKWNGLEKKDIEFLRKKRKKIKIREGVPFIPVFLISFILSLFTNIMIEIIEILI